jgi:hypothetical protein
MTCLNCEELINPFVDEIVPINEGRDWMHRECLLRGVIGSEDCIRRGPHAVGTCKPDDTRLTKREAARAAVRAWEEKELLKQALTQHVKAAG